MSITIRECGHSVETSSKAYYLNPTLCVSCEYLSKYPQKQTYSKLSERLRTAPRDAKGRLVPRIEK